MIDYTGDGTLPNLQAWAARATPPPLPKDPLAFAVWEARDPLPPLSRDNPWKSPGQREQFIENHVALSDQAWDKVQANEEASMWALTFGGDPDLYLEICWRRRGKGT